MINTLAINELQENHGYQQVREIDGKLYGLMRFIYTVGVVTGLDDFGYEGRICFDTFQNAELFFRDWDGITPPVVGEDGCTSAKRWSPP